jgi:hypothetical protein
MMSEAAEQQEPEFERCRECDAPLILVEPIERRWRIPAGTLEEEALWYHSDTRRASEPEIYDGRPTFGPDYAIRCSMDRHHDCGWAIDYAGKVTRTEPRPVEVADDE